MTKQTTSPAPHAGETDVSADPKDGRTPGMAQPPSERKTKPVAQQGGPSRAGEDPRSPSFSSTEDDPLATAGTGGSEDPKTKKKE